MAVPGWLHNRRNARRDNEEYQFSRELGDLRESTITKDYAFNRHSINDGEHVSPFDNGKVQVGADGIGVVLVQGIDEDAFKRTLSAATRATIGIDITPKWEHCPAWEEDDECPLDALPGRLRHEKRGDQWGHMVDPLDDNRDWEEMLRGGLQTALETQVIVFAVKGASRTATHQLVRSRRAAFHQQSQRASYMGDAPEFRMPESVWNKPEVRNIWLNVLIASHSAYRAACEADVSYQDARFILPEGTANFIMLEYPVREFLNVYAYRACSMFQWEIVSIMRQCREVLVAKHPWIAPYVKISCQSGPCPECNGRGSYQTEMAVEGGAAVVDCHICLGTGMVGSKCTFQGWEDVEGQCDFPQAKHELRTFQPKFHRIGRRVDA